MLKVNNDVIVVYLSSQACVSGSEAVFSVCKHLHFLFNMTVNLRMKYFLHEADRFDSWSVREVNFCNSKVRIAESFNCNHAMFW
jgi:hypothetical protein